MRRSTYFSLIELLVVLAVLVVLLAMMMPYLSNSIEMSKRVHCQNDLRSMHQQAQVYQDDSYGWLPSTPKRDYKGNGNEASYAMHKISTWGPTGWYSFFMQGYLDNSLKFCPSSGELNTWNPAGGYLHYGYRYNTVAQDYYLPEGAKYFDRPWLRGESSDEVLFCDSPEYRTDQLGNPYMENVGYVKWMWNHIKGGNLILIDGSAHWLANSAPAKWPHNWFNTDYTLLDDALRKQK